MTLSADTFDKLDWSAIAAQLDSEGYVVLPRLAGTEEARMFAREALASNALRSVSLDSLDLGRGDLLYFGAALSQPWARWRADLYRQLAPIANRWNEMLGMPYRFPADLDAFLERNRRAGQTQAQSHLNQLGTDDYLALHQRSEGEHVFPLQVVALLSAPGKDFTGGELVLTEQRPRMQSRPTVVPLGLGDAAIIAAAPRPFKGSSAYYQVNLRHAISRVRSGERIGVELSFHDAPQAANDQRAFDLDT
ncbi:2OG-Fe(II) oxygenase [Paraburkholderia sp. CNPSo 3076]|uniref:2OG-Fe(II) oxygenase n=1 Tax=Paraburkholderia sp. CNPSo 3076 TaxID=2940936 RepID=UPI002259EB2D|nr:2OG-Fe(II) oxygenase [Paraburkholderia sp. CNPSo 3076]MCX5542468.1 2OG-Fe(II) oxygenase [Paraburkholderia sp. CNPSo 3076]